MITRSYKIDEELWGQAVRKASFAGFSISAIIRALIRLWVDGKVEVKI
jgi:hypothetical protein